VSETADHIRLLAAKYEAADLANDPDGRARAITEVRRYSQQIESIDHQRAWIAFDQRHKAKP